MAAHLREPFVGSRRTFLKRGASAALGLGLTTGGIPLFHGAGPHLLAADAPHIIAPKAIPADPANRTLVVLQLGGGNDGLNTVVPYTDPNYASLRPVVGLNTASVLPISSTLALHPNLSGLEKIFNSGQLAVVEGVEYPQPSYSHFRSTQIWMTGDDQGNASLGWLGHALDHLSNHPALVAASLGITVPQALVGQQPIDIAIGGALNQFKYNPAGRVDPGAVAALYDYMTSDAASNATPYKQLVVQGHENAQAALSGIAQMVATGYTPAVTYPGTSLAASLQTVAQLIQGGVGARVLYLATGGFDTHANERTTHDGLMQTLGDALYAFWQDLTAHGHADDVVLMTFSEFGRRAAENASHGTDHGSASSMFVMGSNVTGGIYGNAPSLTNLNNGNLLVQQDFRQVYASLLHDWLRLDPATALPYGPYSPTPLFAAPNITPNVAPPLHPNAAVATTASGSPAPVAPQPVNTSGLHPLASPIATPGGVAAPTPLPQPTRH